MTAARLARGRRSARTCAVVAVVAAGALLPAGGTIPAAAHQPDDGPRVSTHRTASGMVVSTLRQEDVSVTVYGARVTEVVESGGPHSSLVEVAVADDDAPATALDPTVFEMSLAAGLTPAEACEFATGLDDAGCRTSAEVAAQEASPARALPPPMDDAGSRCATFVRYDGDGSKHNYACIVRREMGKLRCGHDRDLTCVRITNQMKSTAWVEDPGAVYDRLTGAGVQARYLHSKAHAIDWSPNDTVRVGSCRTVTTSVDTRYGDVGGSTTVCPERLNPWHSPAFQHFGARWLSSQEAPADERRGAVAASLVETPNTNRAFRIASYLRWS